MVEEKNKCEACDRNFKDAEGLAAHNKAKHPELMPKEKNTLPIKKIRNWGIFIIILGLFAWGVYALVTASNSFDELPAAEINIGSHQNIALHIHSDLKILIDDEEFLIPANIGILPGIMRPLHTHDSTGEIHIEGPYARDFTVGEFFQIWEQTFNSTCVFEYCTIPGVGEMEMFVNGEKSESYDNLILRDGQEITIEYHSF